MKKCSKALWVMAISTVLAACSSSTTIPQGASVAPDYSAMSNVLSTAVSSELSANPYDTSVIVTSGEYQNMTLNVGQTYYSASGRLCRKAYLLDADGNLLLCQLGDGLWRLQESVL